MLPSLVHKDPPPGLFDQRRTVSHVVMHGVIVGFVLSVVAHFALALWHKNSAPGERGLVGPDALVSGLTARPISRATPAPSGSVAVRY